VPYMLQNLQIATQSHLAILYGKMKIHFYSIHWIIMHIHQRREAPPKKHLSTKGVKWNIITIHNFYKTAQKDSNHYGILL
jgi:hypothetical protein